jgi:uncharacterized protein YciI
MQFIVTGYDGSDSDALPRRMAAREAHLKGAEELRLVGKLLFAAALIDDEGIMVGSCLIVEFADRAEVDHWLETEPYVKGDVWRRIEVRQCRTAPGFGRTPV